MRFEKLTYYDAFSLLCGDQIGDGAHRVVYECRINKELVVKVERDSALFRSFANAKECSMWNDFERVKKVARWLAPCEYLSPDGRILLQRRADPIPSDYQLPDKIPEFLTDIKRENFGILNGSLVCIDYAYIISKLSTKSKKVNWDK